MDYDLIVKEYEAYDKAAVSEWTLGYSRVMKHLEPLEGKIILDYGCGNGKFSRFVRDKGAASVVGVDVSERQIETARRANQDRIRYHCSKESDLSFLADSSCDNAAINFVLCAIYSKEIIRHILKQIHRVLKKGGHLVVLNNNWETSNGKEFISFKFDYVEQLVSGKKVGLTLKQPLSDLRIEDTFWSERDYVEMIEAAGFTIAAIEAPIAEGREHPWINEHKYPPFLIVVATK